MSEIVWAQALDGFGDIAVDLHECRRFIVQTYEPLTDADYSLTYYVSKDGRWIRHKGSEGVEFGEDGEYHRAFIERFTEVHPIEPTHEFLARSLFRKGLPPELEPYREYEDEERYAKWIWDSFHGRTSKILSDESNPKWDRESLTLFVGQTACRKFRKGVGNQIKILDSLHKSNWLSFIKNPLRDEFQLRQTVKYFNRRLRKGCSFRLVCDRMRVGWVVADRSS